MRRELNAISTVDALADDLANRILDGELAPGFPLREAGLAGEYGVGRHTVRESLQRLGHQGLVLIERNRGARVPRLTTDDVRDLYVVRTLIEEGVVRILAENRISLALAEEVLSRFESMPDGTPWALVVEADLAVHRALVAAVGSAHLARYYESLAIEMRFCLSQLRPFYRGPRELAAEHRDVLEAIASRNAGAAAHAMRQHLAMAVSDLTASATAVATRGGR